MYNSISTSLASRSSILALGLAAACSQTPSAPTLINTLQDGLQLPESILHDADQDLYLVSNINGDPLARDNNGYISQLAPDGRFVALRWIEGGKNGVSLDAPKGSAIAGATLYVADIDQVRLFDRRTGAPIASIPIPGATFLNDVAADARGDIYVSDSGLTAGDGGFVPTGTDAIWVIGADRTPRPLLKATSLGQPNGLAASGDRILSASFGAPQLIPVDRGGSAGAATTLPKGQLDGLLVIGDDLFITSWEGGAVYRGKAGGPFTPIIDKLNAPADLGYDARRHRLLVPLAFDNKIMIYDLP